MLRQNWIVHFVLDAGVAVDGNHAEQAAQDENNAAENKNDGKFSNNS